MINLVPSSIVLQRDEYWWYKLNGLMRLFLVNGYFGNRLNVVTVNEYPKSGGSWVGQMLSETLCLPFPRNSLPKFEDSIMHGHYCSKFDLVKPVIVWRDGRDVVVSQYYHWLFYNDKGNESLVNKTRKYLNYSDVGDIEKNLPSFIDYVYSGKGHPKFSWTNFVDRWSGPCYTSTKYENFRLDPVSELMSLHKLISNADLSLSTAESVVEKYSFERQSGRKVGEENKNSFIRKGVVGDWKESFSEDSKDIFKFLAGPQLVKLGYEKDLNW